MYRAPRGPGEGPGPKSPEVESGEKLVPRGRHAHGRVRAAELVRMPRISPPELPICSSESPKPFFLSTNWQIQGGAFPPFFENSGAILWALPFGKNRIPRARGGHIWVRRPLLYRLPSKPGHLTTTSGLPREDLTFFRSKPLNLGRGIFHSFWMPLGDPPGGSP